MMVHNASAINGVLMPLIYYTAEVLLGALSKGYERLASTAEASISIVGIQLLLVRLTRSEA
jgi:hypothetical protein